MIPRPEMIPKLDRKWSRTANDPDADRKWSPAETAKGMEFGFPDFPIFLNLFLYSFGFIN